MTKCTQKSFNPNSVSENFQDEWLSVNLTDKSKAWMASHKFEDSVISYVFITMNFHFSLLAGFLVMGLDQISFDHATMKK